MVDIFKTQIKPKSKPGKTKNNNRSHKKRKNEIREIKRQQEIELVRQKALEQYKNLDKFIKENRKVVQDTEFQRLLTIYQYFLLVLDKDLLPLRIKTWKKIADLQKVHYRTVGDWLHRWYLEEDFEEHRGTHASHFWTLEDPELAEKFDTFVRKCIKESRSPENPQLFVDTVKDYCNKCARGRLIYVLSQLCMILCY